MNDKIITNLTCMVYYCLKQSRNNRISFRHYDFIRFIILTDLPLDNILV